MSRTLGARAPVGTWLLMQDSTLNSAMSLPPQVLTSQQCIRYRAVRLSLGLARLVQPLETVQPRQHGVHHFLCIETRATQATHQLNVLSVQALIVLSPSVQRRKHRGTVSSYTGNCSRLRADARYSLEAAHNGLLLYNACIGC